MKICIIGFPRSRSSILLETLSIYHNIPVIGEDLNRITDRRGGYLDTLATELNRNVNNPSGVVRLHPLQLAAVPFATIDFAHVNFELYDKIYFTFRESIADNIASNFIATKLNKFTYRMESDRRYVKPLEFTSDNYYHVRDYIQSMTIVERIKTYLAEHSIESEDLYYNDIPRYLASHFPGIISFHVETKYNYQKLILNYEHIEEVYQRMNNGN